MHEKETAAGLLIIGLLVLYVLLHNGVFEEVKKKVFEDNTPQITNMMIKEDETLNTGDDYDYRIKNIFHDSIGGE